MGIADFAWRWLPYWVSILAGIVAAIAIAVTAPGYHVWWSALVCVFVAARIAQWSRAYSSESEIVEYVQEASPDTLFGGMPVGFDPSIQGLGLRKR